MVKAIRESGDAIKLRTTEVFELAVKNPYYKAADTHSLDSSELSPQEIFEKVKKITLSQSLPLQQNHQLIDSSCYSQAAICLDGSCIHLHLQ